MIQLSDHFTHKRLLQFTISPILMMIFTSIYSVVDGLFVSNFAGTDQFAALNLIYPIISVLGAVGFMFGAGGTAIVSKTIGEGDEQSAKKYFTLLTIVTGGCGIVMGAVGIIFIKPLAVLLGAEGDILPYSVSYATIILVAMPFFMLQNLFQSFFITAERPKLGFLITVASGVANMILDALFVAVFGWGLEGAAVATAISQAIGGVVPVFYFLSNNSSKLRFVKTRWYGRVILNSITNGSSELLSNIAMSLVSMVYNKQLLMLVGNDGVSAYGVIMYVSFIFVAIFIGYSIGVAPIVGYNYGSQNTSELQNIFKRSMILVSITSVAMFGLCFVLSYPLGYVFFSKNESLRQLTAHAMQVYSVCFLFCGFNIFSSSFFTALNNGLVSAIISFARTLVFQLASILILPIFWGIEGVWISCFVAEILSAIMTFVMFVINNKRYNYVAPKAR